MKQLLLKLLVVGVGSVVAQVQPPNAGSCPGWTCYIENQFCPPGVPGSGISQGYRCCLGQWTYGNAVCPPTPSPTPASLNCPTLLPPARPPTPPTPAPSGLACFRCACAGVLMPRWGNSMCPVSPRPNDAFCCGCRADPSYCVRCDETNLTSVEALQWNRNNAPPCGNTTATTAPTAQNPRIGVTNTSFGECPTPPLPVYSNVDSMTAAVVVLCLGLLLTIVGAVWMHRQYTAELDREFADGVQAKLTGLNDDSVVDDEDDSYAAAATSPTQSHHHPSIWASVKPALLRLCGVKQEITVTGPRMLIGDFLCLMGLYMWTSDEKSGATDRGVYRINRLTVILMAVVDWVDAVLDFGLVHELRVHEETYYATWLGAGTTALVILQLFSRYLMRSSYGWRKEDRDSMSVQVGVFMTVEVIAFLVEDCATLLIFANVPGIFNSHNVGDITNLIISVASGTICATPIFVVGFCAMFTANASNSDAEKCQLMPIWISGVGTFVIFAYWIYITAENVLNQKVLTGEESLISHRFYYASFGLGCLILVVFMLGVCIGRPRDEM